MPLWKCNKIDCPFEMRKSSHSIEKKTLKKENFCPDSGMHLLKLAKPYSKYDSNTINSSKSTDEIAWVAESSHGGMPN